MGSASAEPDKVALITGGASGMGLAVGTALVERGNWTVHLLDMNETVGHQAVQALGPTKAVFHRVNATVYTELSQTFDRVFRTAGRLDFVYGNAGIVEKFSFYAEHDPRGPPPELDMRVAEINLKAVFTTSYLALHYFRQSPGPNKALVLTASCGGIYPVPSAAMYSATKHGVVGFTRSVAPKYQESGIRVNCVCPGTVATGLLDPAAWATYPPDTMTPISMIVRTVLRLVDGDAMTDATGHEVKQGQVYGKAVEINVDKFYFRQQPPWCDEAMARVMGANDRDVIDSTPAAPQAL